MEKFKEMEEESEKRMVEQEERFMHQMNLMETERMRLEEDREERFRQEDRAFLERTLNMMMQIQTNIFSMMTGQGSVAEPKTPFRQPETTSSILQQSRFELERL